MSIPAYRRPLLSLIAVAAMTTTAAACSSASSSSSSSAAQAAPASSSSAAVSSPSGAATASGSSGIRLAEVLANTSDPFFMSIACASQQEASSLGVSLQTFNATNTDTNAIANNFQSAALTKPQGMFADPFDNNQFIAQYKTMMASGVPVVTGNGTTPPAEYKYIYSAADTARFAPEVLKAVPSGAGSLVYLGGAPGIPPLQSRTLPFVKAVESSRADLKALPTEYSGFDVNKATTDLGSILLANPDLKLVIAADGPDAQGAVSAIKAAGKAGKVTLVAFDAIPTEVAALKEGVVTDLIAQSPFQIGRDSVKAIVDYLKAHPDGGAVTNAGTQTIPNQLLTKANVDSPANADYIYKASC
jgi:ribose transport system substrate-binding protein